MRRRTDHLGRRLDILYARIQRDVLVRYFYMVIRGQRIPDVRSCAHRFVLEEESNPLASAPAQGRRRAARAQSLAILHKVGCSWSARPAGVLRSGSAGPTTQLRFVPKRSTPAGRQTGEPTVSHEGCSGLDSSSVLQGTFPSPLCRQSRPIHPTARRVARLSRTAIPEGTFPSPLCRQSRPIHPTARRVARLPHCSTQLEGFPAPLDRRVNDRRVIDGD